MCVKNESTLDRISRLMADQGISSQKMIEYLGLQKIC